MRLEGVRENGRIDMVKIPRIHPVKNYCMCETTQDMKDILHTEIKEVPNQKF